MTSSQPCVLLLGSGELGREVAIELIRLGAFVVAADRYEGAPAMQVAQDFLVFDMTDGDALSAAVERVRPDLVVPEVEAIAVDRLVQLEQGGLRVVPTAFAVRTTMDRQAIRTLAAEELGLPTSPFAFASTFDEVRAAADCIGFPLFIKPTMSSSGHGQSLVRCEDELQLAWDAARSGARSDTGRVIVEGMVDFDFEITLLTLRSIGEDGQVRTDFCDPIGHRQSGGDYVESWQPQPMSPVALERAQQIARAVTDRLGGLGIYGVELFVKGDDVTFSELSPRPHDTGMVTMATQRFSQFGLHARALLGLSAPIVRFRDGASAAVKSAVKSECPVCVGIVDALLVPESDVRIFRKPVAHLGRRMAVGLATGDDVGQARERAARVAGALRIEEGHCV